MPFGGGPRKCLGDQFALMEAVIALAMMLRRFEFSTKEGFEPGMKTGATIHTANGLIMEISKREMKGSSEDLKGVEQMVAK